MSFDQEGTCPTGRFWRVEEGDTLFKIATELGLALEDLLELNPGIDPENLQVGQLVCLPAEFPPCPSGVFWEVAAGDTLYSIAIAVGTTVEKLFELNPGIDPYNLRIGQKICLP